MKKGVSPVVATVLIIAIAVMASISVWYWVSSLTGKPATPMPQLSITIVACRTTSTLTTMDITNTGGKSVGAYFDIYYSENGSKLETATLTVSDLAAGDSTTVEVQGAVLSASIKYLLRTSDMPDVTFQCRSA